MWIQDTPNLALLAFGPDGRTLYTLHHNGAMIAWDVATRTDRKLADLFILSFPRGIYPLADDRRIVLLSKKATVFDVRTGRELGGVTGLTDHKSGLCHITPEGRLFYLKPGGVAVMVWNLATRKAEPHREIPKAARRGIRSYAVSQDGQLVALVGLKNSVTVYDWGDGPELQAPLVLGGTADSVRFSPDGRTLALLSERKARTWDVTRNEPWSKPVNIGTKNGDATFAFHPSAPMFFAIGRDRLPTLFGTETGEAIRALDFAMGKDVRSVCFSPGGLTCAVGSNKRFAVFDVDV